MHWLKRIITGLAIVLIVSFIGIRIFAPRIVERSLNGVYDGVASVVVSPQALALHKRLFLADLHADSLLFGRDLRERSAVGHIDIPRMQEGNLALQAFAVTTKTPQNLNIDRNDDKTDSIFWLGLVNAWPYKTYGSLKERTLFLGQRLHELPLRVIRTRRDLEKFGRDRATDPQLVAGFLSIEGLHALEGDIANIAVLDDAGFRMIGLAHFFDNEVAGSAHGLVKGGLTPLGRRVVPELERRHVIIDLAHSSAQTIDEVLAMATRPVAVSHTGVKGTCNNNRNLSDGQLQRIAANGGLIGIGYWEEAICAQDAAAVARAISYAIKVAGVEHVALGSDFDGTTFTPFDAAGLPQLTQALLDSGLDELAIAAVMGENARRFLLASLPP